MKGTRNVTRDYKKRIVLLYKSADILCFELLDWGMADLIKIV